MMARKTLEMSALNPVAAALDDDRASDAVLLRQPLGVDVEVLGPPGVPAPPLAGQQEGVDQVPHDAEDLVERGGRPRRTTRRESATPRTSWGPRPWLLTTRTLWTGRRSCSMAHLCPECGAPTPEGSSCRDQFHALLLLEAEIPGGPGALPHFYAVASYGLQHPDSMNYTAAALAGLRASLADVLDGRATLDEIGHRTRRALDGPVRVTRRRGDAVVPWLRGRWPMTDADVLTVDRDADTYGERVARWARSVREVLDAERS
jgi:hypothetical protein